MRVQLLLILAIVAAVHAASPRPPKPPAPTSFTCNSSTASSLGTTLSNSINEALLPNATKVINQDKTNPYWSFTVPSLCWTDIFGFGLSFCNPNAGNYYEGATSTSTTVTGAYNMKVNVSLAQTSCTAAQGAAGTWSMTATWPKITADAVLAIDTVGGKVGIEAVVTITNMVVQASGTYGYTVNGSTDQLCVTALDATDASATASDVTATLGLNGAPGTSIPKIANKVKDKLTTVGPQILTKLNDSFAKKIGKCKTVGTARPPASPRSPAAPRPPRSAGRR